MKDINLVIDILNQNKIPQSKYAEEIGTSRQNVHNWTKSGEGIPKKFLAPTVKFIKDHVNKKFSSDVLLNLQSKNNKNKTNKAITKA